MGDVNAAQRESWNGPGGRHWIEHEALYEAQLASYVTPLLDAARIEADSRVLDVGCGFGTTTLAAAERAAQGVAVGVDISHPLIERARERATSRGAANVRFIEADAQIDSPGGPFDAVISRFGVMFFSDPNAAFTNIATSTAPAGSLSFMCWQPFERNGWMRVPGEAMASIVDLGNLAQPCVPGPYSFADPGRVRDVLDGAGFADVELTAIDDPIVIGGGDSLDDAVTFLRGSSLGRSAFSGADAATERRLVDAVRDAIAPFATADGVVLDAAAWLVTASRR
jgi:SAM-dependent methyltransferase